MNKNILIGIAVIGIGLYLSKRAKDQGKSIPLIGRFIPSKPKPAPAVIRAPKSEASQFSRFGAYGA